MRRHVRAQAEARQSGDVAFETSSAKAMAPKSSRGGGEAALDVLVPRLGRPALEALLLSYESVLPKGRLRKGVCSVPGAHRAPPAAC